jgi:hypothetical protein
MSATVNPRPSRNCQSPAEPRFGQARSPVRGRSEAKWLDRAADRRTISRRDGHRADDRGACQRTRTALEARWWKRGGRRRSSAAAVQNSERVRAHLYERECRAKPVRRRDGARERGAQGSRIMRRTRRLSKTGAVRPDERDIRLGRERPPPSGPWGEEGGMAGGVAHAPDASFTIADSRPDCDTGGTERRQLTASNQHIAKDIAGSVSRAFKLTSPRRRRSVARGEGEHCSHVCVPPRSGRDWRATGGETEVSEGPRSFRPDLFTGLAGSYRERLIWSELRL